MLLNKAGQSITVEDKVYTVGMSVCATETSTYEGMFGVITEIRDGEDKETENKSVDIICEFNPHMSIMKAREIEQRFSRLHGQRKSINDLGLDYVVLSPEMLRPVERCRVYQIDPPDAEFAFKGHGELLEKGFPYPPAELYKVVFDGLLETDDLEDIFRIFNIAHPADYTGRSLSVSDIVELYTDNDAHYYYCDVMGFIEVSFMPVEG